MESGILFKCSQLQNFSSNEESPVTDESKDSIDFNENLSFFNEDQVNELNDEPKLNLNQDSKKDKNQPYEIKENNIVNINANCNNDGVNINNNNNLTLLKNENFYFPLFNIGYKEFLCKNDKINNNFYNNETKNGLKENNLNINENLNNNFFSKSFSTQNNVANINNINNNNINIKKFIPPFSKFEDNNNIEISNDFMPKKYQKNFKSKHFNNKKQHNIYNNEIINFNIFIENLNTPLEIFICSQTGSRMLQNNLSFFSSQIIDILIEKIKSHFEKLMSDLYGNYFCQKLYSISSIEQRILILDSIKDSFVSISKTKSGSHVAQSLIEQALSLEEKKKIMNFILNFELEMALDTEGTHVIQKIIQIFPEKDRQSLTDVLCKSNNVNILCKDLKGISVIKRFICFNCDNNNRMKLVDSLYDICSEVVKTSSGSYILQFLIEEWGLNTGIKLILYSIYNFEFFAGHKHGANFINKIIILCLSKINVNRYFINEQNAKNIKAAMAIINALKNLILDFSKIINVYECKCAKALIFNIRKLFNNVENEKLFLYIKSLETVPNILDNKKYQIYMEIFKSQSATL